MQAPYKENNNDNAENDNIAKFSSWSIAKCLELTLDPESQEHDSRQSYAKPYKQRER